MTNNLTASEAEALAQAAQARSELTQTEEAFDAFRAEMVTALVATQPGQTADREQLYMAIRVLDRVRAAVRVLADSTAPVVEYNALIRSILAEGEGS